MVVDVEAYRNGHARRGDVVVLHPPTGASTQQQCGVPSDPADGHPCARATRGVDLTMQFIKRVVAVGGDQIKVIANRTYIGGRAQAEPFINKGTPCDPPLCNLPRPITVPAGYYFVLGDNRGQSDDSRDWGPVPQSSIVGRVVGVK